MKTKKGKIILCIVTLVISILSAAIGYGFMGETNISFPIKFICGFIFIVTTLLVIQLVILLWRKDK